MDDFDFNLTQSSNEDEPSYINIDDSIDLTERDPTINNIMIGMGWDITGLEQNELDLDVCLFLLDKNEQTRIDEDFIYFNNLMALDGAIKHHGDNKTGAGEGDDECISISLHGIPFDVVNIMIVLSIYQGYEKQQSFSDINKGYIRIVNEANEHEILRFDTTPHFSESTQNTMIVGTLDREGPKWHFRPKIEYIEGGLEKIATDKGLIVIQQ